MKNRIKILIISAVVILIASCQSNVKTGLLVKNDLLSVLSMVNSQIIVDTGSPYNNYVTIKAEQFANVIGRDSSYTIGVYAKFTSNGSVVNAGPIYINSRSISAGTGNLYQYNYQGSTLAEGKALFGTTVQVDIPGISDPPTSTPQSLRYIVVPKEIFPSSLPLPLNQIDRTSDFPLTWNTDPNNQYQKVQITVSYYKAISQYNGINMPNSVANLYYTVSDNGFFQIPKTDLARFPKGSYAFISIARASYYSSTNRIVYIGIMEAHTIPLLVVDGTNCNISITGNDVLCNGTTSYTLTGAPLGAQVRWESSNPSIATAASNANPTTVTKVGTGIFDLTATYLCGSNIKKSIAVGKVQPGPITFPLIDPFLGKLQAQIDPVPGATSYNWYKNGVLQTGHGAFIQMSITKNQCNVYYDISVAAINSCGTSLQKHGNAYVPPCNNAFTMSPNPASNSINISPAAGSSQLSANATIDEISIYDSKGTLRKYQKVNTSSATINIQGLNNGTYIVQITNGTYQEKHQLVVQN